MAKTILGFELAPVAAGAALLRTALGVLFFFAGLGKFLSEGGAAGFASGLIAGFEETWLPAFLLIPFAYALPYIEFTVGLFLLLGLRCFEALTVCGLLLIALSFGKILQHDHATVGVNLNYVLMAAVGIWMAAQDNRYSLDAFMTRFRRSDGPSSG